MQRKGRYQPVSIEIGTCHAYNNNGDEDSDNENDNTAMATMMAMAETEITPSALSSSMSLDEATSIASISAEETLFVKRNKRRRRQQQQHNITIRFSISFWILGLLNNTGYVIMIAAAKSISEGGVALVFLANILPALVVKGTAPYWFDYVSYKTRITVATFLMVISFAVVASSSSSLPWQLTGVAFTSAQGALGEASLLALAGKIDGSIASSESNASNTEDESNIRRRKQQRQRQRQEVVNGTIDNNQQCDIDDEDDVNHSANINQNDEYIINNNDQNDQQHQQQRHQQKQSEEEEKGRCLTGFSSGTGFAGVFGFFWKWFWNKWLGLSLSTTLWLATILAVGYLFAYRYVTYLQKQQKSIMTTTTTAAAAATAAARELVESSQRQKIQKQCYRDRIDGDHEDIIVACCDNNSNNNSNNDPEEVSSESSLFRLNGNKTIDNNNDYDNDDRNDDDNNNSIEEKLDDETMMVKEISTMTGQQRFHLVLSLWPYMIPLFLVYLAEYTLQSGTWTAIGFPVTDRESRDIFYEYSNWMYQAGVFFSRSSGTFFLAPMAVLWIMPILQVINVGIYWAIAANQQHDANNYDDSGGFFYGPTFLYSAAFYTGLLGGAVYIHGYLRICRDLPLAHREFALSATSLAECLGIVVADFFGLLVQACLYRINNLEGAVINCPSSFN